MILPETRKYRIAFNYRASDEEYKPLIMLSPGSQMGGYNAWEETSIGSVDQYGEFVNMINAQPYADEIKHFINKLFAERYYASIVYVHHSDNARREYYNSPEEVAYLAFMQAIFDSSNRYGPLIRALAADKAALIAESKSRKRLERSKGEEVERIDDSYTDSSLRKENNTPGAGANPNLIEDTYLSFSERTKVEGDERKSVTNTVAAPEDNFELEIHENDAEAIVKLDIAMADIYDRWLKFIDRGWLVV